MDIVRRLMSLPSWECRASVLTGGCAASAKKVPRVWSIDPRDHTDARVARQPQWRPRWWNYAALRAAAKTGSAPS